MTASASIGAVVYRSVQETVMFACKLKEAREAAAWLRLWASDSETVPTPYRGICYNLRSVLMLRHPEVEWVEAVCYSALDWPEHSGVHGYPVPAVGENTIAAYFADEDVWSGPYGESRKRLCIHLAEKFEKDGLPLRCLKLHTMGFFERLKWGIMKMLFNH